MKKLVLLTMALVVATTTVAVAAVHTVGGAGGTGNTIPWWGNYSGLPQIRFMTIWRQSDIGEAGKITLVEHQDWSTSSSGGTFTGCLIKLCHTAVAAISSTFATNYGGNTPVTCFSGTKVVPNVSNGTWWTVMSGSSLFDYNNTNNLLYEVSWTARSGGPNYINHTRSGQTGRVWAASATATTGSITVGYGTLARITIVPTGVAPTSLGRVKSIFK
ncbi:MAG: hypothetical protein V3T41_02025 [bacterium]